MSVTEAEIEAAARAICRARDLDPETRFQDDNPPKFPEDGHFFNSREERCTLYFAWRKFATVAKIALEAAEPVRMEEGLAVAGYEPKKLTPRQVRLAIQHIRSLKA